VQREIHREGEGENVPRYGEPPGVRQEGRALYFRSITCNPVDPPPRFVDSTRSAPLELGRGETARKRKKAREREREREREADSSTLVESRKDEASCT